MRRGNERDGSEKVFLGASVHCLRGDEVGTSVAKTPACVRLAVINFIDIREWCCFCGSFGIFWFYAFATPESHLSSMSRVNRAWRVLGRDDGEIPAFLF